MCGRTGFITDRARLGSQLERAEILERMCAVISHRGPDDQGTMVKDVVALGMRRLSIIDLSGGHQPMTSRGGDFTLVFNGEIYNYRELQRQLQAQGYSFQTKSDTESILRSYEAYGDNCVDHLRGTFAFALWDPPKRKLLIA